jgi:O-antigen/teichoic acid export membrane protein
VRPAARNISTNYLVYGLSILSGLVLTPVIIDAVGTPAYGAWSFVLAATTILRLIDLGMTPTIVRFSAFHRGRGEVDEVSGLASTALAVYAVLGAVCLVAGLLFAWLLPALVSIPGELEGPARFAGLLAVWLIAVELPLSTFSSLLKGAQRFDLINLPAIVGLVAYVALVLGVLTQVGTLEALVLLTIASTAIRVLPTAVLVRGPYPRLRLSRTLVDRGRLAGLLRFSGYVVAVHVASKVVFAADTLLVGLFLDVTAVALYAVVARLFAVGSALSTTGIDVLYPLQSELAGREDSERRRRFLAAGMRTGTCVAGLVATPLVVIPGAVLTAWLGPGFEESRLPLAFLGGAVFFTVPTALLSQYLLASGRPRDVAAVQGTLALGNLGTSCALLAATGGIWGPALSTLVFQGLSAVSFTLMLRAPGEAEPRALAAAWLRPAALAAAAAVPLLLVPDLLADLGSLQAIVPLALVWTAAFAALAWRFALGDSERELFARLWRRPAEVPPAL